MSVEAGAQERDMATVRIPISLPFRNCGNDKSGSFAEAEAYHSFYRKLARGHFNPRAPRGALPIASWAIFPLVLVSTHAPREGRDTPPPTAVIAPTSFNPRAPMGRDCQSMHDSGLNCMKYAIFKLPKNPSSNYRPEMPRFLREPRVWIAIAWGSRTSGSRAPELIVTLEFTRVHYRASKNVRVRTTQKRASPAHRLPNQHGIPNPIPLRPFGHGATASRRPYCTQHHFLVALPRRFRRFALAGASRRAINMMAGLVCGKERNRAATAGHGRQSERREEEGSWLRTRLRYCAPVASSATCAAACW